MFKRFTSLLTVCGALAGSLYVVACSSSKTGGNNKVSLTPDAPGSGSGTDAASACADPSSYSPGAFGSDQTAVNFPASGSGSSATAHFEEWDGNLNADGTDFLDIELYQGYGAFGSGDIANGVYNISGDDAAFSSCGLCLTVFTGAAETGSGSAAILTVTGAYTASSGSVNLTSVSTTLTGTLTNVQFQHVNTTEMNGFPNPDDPPAIDSCTTSIGSASFSATLQAGSAAVPDGQPRHIRLQLK